MARLALLSPARMTPPLLHPHPQVQLQVPIPSLLFSIDSGVKVALHPPRIPRWHRTNRLSPRGSEFTPHLIPLHQVIRGSTIHLHPHPHNPRLSLLVKRYLHRSKNLCRILYLRITGQDIGKERGNSNSVKRGILSGSFYGLLYYCICLC